MNVLLYLCSNEPDLDGAQPQALSTSYPHLTATRQGLKFIEPKNVSLINVGKHQGEQLRKAHEVSVLLQRHSGGRGVGKRTHVRRGHYHKYWIGSRKSEVRKFKFHWLSPIVVND